MDILHIGVMFNDTDPENPVQIEGWHVNSLQPIPNAEPFLVQPINPKVGVLGHASDAVYRYVFNDKEQADAIIEASQ